MVSSKKTIIFQSLRGVQHFSGSVQLFQGGGVHRLISIESHITFDCAAAQTEENSHCVHCGTSGLNI